MTRERKWRIVLGSTALLVTAYYVVGEMLINLYAQVALFHVCWITALGILWYRAMRPKFAVLPNLASVAAIGIALFLAQAHLDHVCKRTYEETQQLGYQRLGVAPGDCETKRDPWEYARLKAFDKDQELLATLRKVMVDRAPGWCRATVILAEREGLEVPRVINWTAADPVFLCGTGACRDPLPYPRLSMGRAGLRIESELIASAEPLRKKMIEKMQ